MVKSKKFIIGAIIAGLILGIAGGVYYFMSKNQAKKVTSLNTDLSENKKEDSLSGELLYKDEAGFSFRYPEGITVKDITPDDGVYYSELTLTKDAKSLKISVFDTKEANLDAYIKKDTLLGKASLYGAVKLGEMSAKQYSTGSLLYTVALDQGVVYMVESSKDGAFWEKAQGVVVDTFSLSGQTGGSSAGGVDNTIYEEEEVVE